MKTTKKQCNSSNNNKQSLYHINNNSVESIKKNSFKEIYEFNCVIFDGTSKSNFHNFPHFPKSMQKGKCFGAKSVLQIIL